MVVSPQHGYTRTGSVTTEIPAASLAELRHGMKTDWLYILRHIGDPSFTFEAEGTERLGNIDTTVLRIKGPDIDVRWNIDQQTGHLVRISDNLGTTLDYSDWRNVDGLAVPFERHLAKGIQSTIYSISEYELNPSYDSGLFSPPAPTPPAPTAIRNQGSGQVTVQVVGSQQGSWQQHTQIAPGQPTTAETNCTGIDPVNCKTVEHPATAPTVITQNIHEVWVNAIVGDRHVRLWCQKYFRDCRDLEAGSYTGEIKEDSVYLDTFNLGGKKKRIKYKVVGSW